MRVYKDLHMHRDIQRERERETEREKRERARNLIWHQRPVGLTVGGRLDPFQGLPLVSCRRPSRSLASHQHGKRLRCVIEGLPEPEV